MKSMNVFSKLTETASIQKLATRQDVDKLHPYNHEASA